MEDDKTVKNNELVPLKLENVMLSKTLQDLFHLWADTEKENRELREEIKKLNTKIHELYRNIRSQRNRYI